MEEISGFINGVVFSEVVFITLRVVTGLPAYRLRESPEIVNVD